VAENAAACARSNLTTGSFPRKREPPFAVAPQTEIPAFAGMTSRVWNATTRRKSNRPALGRAMQTLSRFEQSDLLHSLDAGDEVAEQVLDA
jgi:hypothetical protein